MPKIILASKIASAEVEPISYVEAQQRVSEGKPTFWLHQWWEKYPSGSSVFYRHLGTNTDAYVTAWKRLHFPYWKPSVEKMSQPEYGESGWWFGIPVN